MTDRAYAYLPGITNLQISIKSDCGYATFESWRRASFPGSVNGTTGKVNGARPYDDWQRELPASRIRPAKASCSVEGCDKITASRQLCYLHYERQRVVNRRHAAIPSRPYIKPADR